jgi:hypothetical protein
MAAGDFRQLKRRLTMIRDNETDRRHAAGRTLGRAGLAALCAGAAALLPLAPSLAQVESAPATVEVRPAETPAPEGAPRAVRVETRLEPRAPQGAPSAENAPVPTTVIGPGGHVVQLQPAGEGVFQARIDATPSVTTVRGAEVRLDPAPASTVDEARSEVERLSRELERAKARLADLERAGGASNFTPTAVRSYRVTRRAAPTPANNADPTHGDSDRRLDELERKLDRLLGEVERLKGNRSESDRGNGRPATSAAPLTEIP